MDTQLNQPAAHKRVVGPNSVLRSLVAKHGTSPVEQQSGNYSAETVRTVRIGVAEYARAGGMRDPEDVVVFTQLCIHEAAQRLAAKGSDKAGELLDEALKVAATSCGVDPNTAAPLTSSGNATKKPGLSPTPGTKGGPISAVPKSRPRVMPPQPLGELPDVTPARMWNGMLRSAWQPVWILVTKIYERVSVESK